MEKQKYNITGDMERHDGIYVDVNGERLLVVPHIPLAEKLAMANELVTFITLIDDDLEMISESHLYDVGLVYLTIKYYTDADLEDVEPSAVFDWVINSGAYDKDIEGIVYDDRNYVVKMASAIYINISNAYMQEHGLAHAVKKTFGFMFNGEDITETLAKSREVSETMIDVIGKLNSE